MFTLKYYLIMIDFDQLKFPGKPPGDKAFKETVAQKKSTSINYAINLRGCNTQGTFFNHIIWTSNDGHYKVGVRKYGKEYYKNNIKYKDDSRSNNPNDMNPTIWFNNEVLEFDSSFGHIFNFFEEVSKVDSLALELLGDLMCRNAFLLDHTINEDLYNYHLPEDVLKYISDIIVEFEDIPVEAFIRYIDLIGLNEDVKYSTLGYNVLTASYGRRNNMLTYAHIIAVLLRKAPLYDLCKNFASVPVGVSALTLKKITDVFVHLK